MAFKNIKIFEGMKRAEGRKGRVERAEGRKGWLRSAEGRKISGAGAAPLYFSLAGTLEHVLI